jgi:hypothetical protein
MNTLDDGLFSLEKLDRTSPELWPEQSMAYDKKYSFTRMKSIIVDI